MHACILTCRNDSHCIVRGSALSYVVCYQTVMSCHAANHNYMFFYQLSLLFEYKKLHCRCCTSQMSLNSAVPNAPLWTPRPPFFTRYPTPPGSDSAPLFLIQSSLHISVLHAGAGIAVRCHHNDLWRQKRCPCTGHLGFCHSPLHTQSQARSQHGQEPCSSCRH